MHNNRSYYIEYQNCYFESELELTWFIFLGELELTKSNIASKPFSYKNGFHGYPEFRFILSGPSYTEVFAQVKPLRKSQFDTEMTLDKNMFGDSVVCLLGESNVDYKFLNDNHELTELLDQHFLSNTEIWKSSHEKAIEIERKYGLADISA